MKGCLRRGIIAVIVLFIIGGLYLYRHRITDAVYSLRSGHAKTEVPSAALGDIAYNKLEDLRLQKSDSVALTTAELQSLVQYRFPGLVPAFAQDPHITLQGDRLKLKVRVPIDKLPSLKGMGDAASFLPDTTDVSLTGKLMSLPSGRLALSVDAVEAAGIPLPSSFVNKGLRSVGRRTEAGLPANAIAVTLPDGVSSAYIRNDSLILLTRRHD